MKPSVSEGFKCGEHLVGGGAESDMLLVLEQKLDVLLEEENLGVLKVSTYT